MKGKDMDAFLIMKSLGKIQTSKIIGLYDRAYFKVVLATLNGLGNH